MKKALEVLEIGKKRTKVVATLDDGNALLSKQEVEIIEKELKEYEEMKRIKGTTTLDSALEETLIKACPNVAKKLKALEIIKNKQIDAGLFEYDYRYGGNNFKLTQEEYNLLKEVLL